MPRPVGRACRAALLIPLLWASSARGQSGPPRAVLEESFSREIRPFLVSYCYDCHGGGAAEGNRAFDVLEQRGELLGDLKLWSQMLGNMRANIMPPADSPQPGREEVERVAEWIKREVYRIDPAQPDPGPSVLRRLNRTEYQNTIRDLMGYDYDVLLQFPPDDTGFGFDTIGEVLTISPMLTEKYLAAAAEIVAAAFPRATRVVAETRLTGEDFADRISAAQPEPNTVRGNRGWPLTGKEIHFDEQADLQAEFLAVVPGHYEIDLEIRVDGQFEYNPNRSHVRFFLDDQECVDQIHVYDDGVSFFHHFEQDWQPGIHRLRFDVQPLGPAEGAPRGRPDVYVRLKIVSVTIKGPTAPEQFIRPANYDRFFPRESPPADEAERLDYARDVLRQFAARAFRRPVDDSTVEALARIAALEYQKPDKTFEQGIGRAVVAVLASPRFLYRLEGWTEGHDDPHPLVDEFALASRLSYLLWSTMPDEELLELAAAGRLRDNQERQVQRLLADSRSDALIQNFVGQWLRSRDVEHVRIDGRAVLLGDQPPAAEGAGRGRGGRGAAGRGRGGRGGRGGPAFNFDGEIRDAMRQETDLHFAHIMRNDRSVLELLDADYAFLNERLAELYKIDGVAGNQMRLVELPEESPRGGVLTQATLLTITSNPDRTSPVKRGLYLLENILGTPPPAPPASVPDLEETAEKFAGRTPTLREVLEAHRENVLCQSCHSRMDPLGLALENFNALGMWRDQERGQPINSAGRLISGEEFRSVAELKQILLTTRRRDFYTCMTEKLMTYALGRGVEPGDQDTIDRIVADLESQGGKFSALLTGVIESPQFQRKRKPDADAPASRDED